MVELEDNRFESRGANVLEVIKFRLCYWYNKADMKNLKVCGSNTSLLKP